MVMGLSIRETAGLLLCEGGRRASLFAKLRIPGRNLTPPPTRRILDPLRRYSQANAPLWPLVFTEWYSILGTNTCTSLPYRRSEVEPPLPSYLIRNLL